jgi:two-component system, LuxR family, sensor kinase FixL
MAQPEEAPSDSRWRSIIQSAVDAIVLIDASGRIESFNRAAERLFGYREAEVLGQNVSMLMPEPYRGEHDGYLERYLSTGQRKIIGIGREVTGVRCDGSKFPLHLSVGEAMVDGERKFTGIIHDLSERVRLEDRLRASEARWRSIVESAVDGIVVIDSHGLVEAFNPAAERLFGYTEAEVIGKNVNMLMPSPYHEEHDEYMSRYLRTGAARIIGIGREVTAQRRDGTTFPVHLSVGEMSVNGERKFTGILHDLSARIRMEEKLREQNALARLGEMAAVIAHEVKNPLAGVRGAIQVIGGRLPKESKDAAIVKEILTRIDALNELMKDLLLFARPPQPRLAPVDLAGLIQTTADLLSTDPAIRGVAIQVAGAGAPVIGDAELLKILFQNLIVNGAQAMQGHGAIHVTLESTDGVCRVAVRDGGPGIPPEVLGKLFTPFFTTKSRGTGLGLPTAKRIVEAHGGSIAITSVQGAGTTVELSLPLAATAV